MVVYNLGMSTVDQRRRKEISHLPNAFEKFFCGSQRHAVSSVEYKAHRTVETGSHGGFRPMKKDVID